MATILLSINPEYVERIFNGSKKFEFRKHLAQKNISKIIVYSTYPEMKIVGEVQVIKTLSMAKTPLWELTKKEAGISRNKYRKYFADCHMAHAYVLGDVKKYDVPKALGEYGVTQAPQSFIYLKD
jgi:predicted transcriptional regulator